MKDKRIKGRQKENIVLCLLELSGFPFKHDFQVVFLFIKPDAYFFFHRVSPLFLMSVKNANGYV
jgi:hypothetical protein